MLKFLVGHFYSSLSLKKSVIRCELCYKKHATNHYQTGNFKIFVSFRCEVEPAIMNPFMILVTGGTGFIGRSLVRQLIASGQEVRTLLRPSKTSPKLPRGMPVEAAVCSLMDERGLRAALRGVDVVYHLAGSERHSAHARLQEVDIQGTQTLVNAAVEAGVQRIITVSHLGADRNSAYPVLKAKGLAEYAIVQSGLPYTIFRSGAVFGPGDQFTVGIARLLLAWPGPFLLPGEGDSLVQPLWIDDLTATLMIAMENLHWPTRPFRLAGSRRSRTARWSRPSWP